jgi:hypothetical protein
MRGRSLSWKDIADLRAKPSQIGRVSADPSEGISKKL